MTTLNAIRIALENRLATTTPALPGIAWPNVPFTPTTGTAYLRSTFIPVTRRPVTAGPNAEQLHTGLFMVNIYTPEDAGASAGMTYADQLLDRFKGSDAEVSYFVAANSPLDAYALSDGGISYQPLAVFDADTQLAQRRGTVTVRFAYSEAKRPLHEPPFYVIPVEISWYSYVPQGV